MLWLNSVKFQNFHFLAKSIFFQIRGVPWDAPKRMWKMYFSRDSIFLIFWNAPKSKNFIFGLFSGLKLITCYFFEMPQFFMFEFFEMHHFSYMILKMGKSGAFQKISTWSILKPKRNRKWKFSIFGHLKKLGK